MFKLIDKKIFATLHTDLLLILFKAIKGVWKVKTSKLNGMDCFI